MELPGTSTPWLISISIALNYARISVDTLLSSSLALAKRALPVRQLTVANEGFHLVAVADVRVLQRDNAPSVSPNKFPARQTPH